MTPAERLRAAAEKIRATAAGAVPVLPAFNRWGVTSDPLGIHVENGDGKGRIAMMVGGDRLDGRGHDTAQHIALWSPPAALLAGKVLDQHADGHSIYDCQWVDCDALALADLILGADS